MPSPFEKPYQPSPEEIKKAEESTTEERKELSKKRKSFLEETKGVSGIVSTLEYALGRDLNGHEHWAITEYVNEGGAQEDYNEAVEIYDNLLEEAIEKHGGVKKDRSIGESKLELGRLIFKFPQSE